MPKDLGGTHVVGIVACYAGSVTDAERVLAPLERFGAPVLDLCVPKPFLAHQAVFDPSFQRGYNYDVRSCDVAELSDSVIDIVSEFGRRIVSPITGIALGQMGGAVDVLATTRRLFTDATPASRSISTAMRRPRKVSRPSATGPAATGRRSRRTTRASTSTS